jgi:hypothetical protein
VGAVAGTLTLTATAVGATDMTVAVKPPPGPAILTLVGSTKPLPLIVTRTCLAPWPRVAGVIPVIVGGARTETHPVHVALVPGSLTVTSKGPVGTSAAAVSTAVIVGRVLDRHG